MTRQLAGLDAAGLAAGSDHYRAYVGPPARFGPLSALQFNLLFALGMEETDRVLDFGCGSLRLGRLLIPFLLPERYFGVEPNSWLIEEALARETGRNLLDVKRPRFSDDDRFDCTVFGERFDFIMAQSIITHAGPEATLRLFLSAGESLAEDGLFALSFILAPDDAPLPTQAWTYPHNVAYPEPWLRAIAKRAGLHWRLAGWHHPGARWALLARDERRLPPPDAALGFAGKPHARWRAPQDAD